MATISLYLGEGLPPNLVRFLSGLGKIADDEFDFELVGRDVDPAPLPNRFTYHEIPGRTPDRGVDELRTAYRDLRTYLRNRSTAALWQITTPHFHAIPATIAARQAGVPVATRIPGRKFREFRTVTSKTHAAKLFALNNLQLRLTRFSDHVVTLNEDTVRTLRSVGIPANHIALLRPPIDTDEFAYPSARRRTELRKALGIEDETLAILFVGRLSKLKGAETLDAVARDLPASSRYELHLVGEGDYSKRLSAHDNVAMHGRVDPSKVHEYYKAADLYLHPSKTEMGGISWTMIEAAATGLPVVARDVGNADGLASFVFEEDGDVVQYLSDTDRWSAARYPEEWSLEALEPAYNAFLDGLASGDQSGVH